MSSPRVAGSAENDLLCARVDLALQGFIDAASPALEAIGEELRPMAELAGHFVLDGGKRLRPAFCYWAYRAVGGVDDEAVVRAAASLELLQASALVHDDVIDRSDTRRGEPSAHRQFAALHADNGWRGDPGGFGNAAAVLLGDLFLVWADTMIAGSGIPDSAWDRARPVYDEMRVELMGGQYLDVVEQARGGGSVDRALRVARFKAAKYTIERPLHLGGAIGAAEPTVMAAFSKFGLPLGEAFQLRDDLLGVLGDPLVTGKPAGDDLREGKRTVLVALAEAAATTPQRAMLERHLGSPDLDEDGVAALRDIVSATGAVARVEAMIDERLTAAFAALEDADLDPVGRRELVALASAATDRAH